jgi:hypothetical protein
LGRAALKEETRKEEEKGQHREAVNELPGNPHHPTHYPQEDDDSSDGDQGYSGHFDFPPCENSKGRRGPVRIRSSVGELVKELRLAAHEPIEKVPKSECLALNGGAFDYSREKIKGTD